MLLSAWLTAAFFGFLPLLTHAEEVPEPQAETLCTEVTEPAVTQPPPAPEETLPPETEPPESQPAETQPEETTLPATEPETTPPETVPEETAPEETAPADTAPVETTSPETLPPETAPEETAPPAEAPAANPPAVPPELLPISRVLQLPADGGSVAFYGTVVLVRKNQAVVQDDTGGIRLTLPEGQSAAAGDRVLVTGLPGTPFAASNIQKEGAGSLPAVKADFSKAPEALRIVVRGGVLREHTLTKGGRTLPIRGAKAPQGKADVTGVILDGVFHADSVKSLSRQTLPKGEWNAYFGLLHAHTNISDGDGTVTEAFSHAASVKGLDFFAVTDHSDSFDNAEAGEITADGSAISAEWAAGQQAAAAVTNEHFVGLYGYEMTWGEAKALGHINTFGTPGWQTPRQITSLPGYYRALAKVPGSVSQFNHPSPGYGDFRSFRDYDPAYDAVMQLLEIEGEQGASYYAHYIRALDQGWHVAPTAGQDNHHGNWGGEGRTRTAVLARELTRERLYEAMGQRRVYTTQDPDLYVEYRLNGQIMGSVIGLSDTLTVHAVLADPTDEVIGTVEAISSGGKVLASRKLEDAGGEVTFSVPAGYPYYFLRIVQPDGDTAVTAPVWVDAFADMGIRSFSADPAEPKAGQPVELSVELFNNEEVSFSVTGVSLLLDGKAYGTFTDAGQGRYTLRFLWNAPGEVRLTAVVQGTVNGSQRSYREDLILHYSAQEVKAVTIAQCRRANSGQVYEITGYATSGNTLPGTIFPDTIYVQDKTGGIPVLGDFPEKIQIGTRLKITGVLRWKNREPYLERIGCELPDKPMYRHVPKTQSCKDATNYSKNGGALVQTEGEVIALTKTANGRGISRLTLKDSQGGTATAVIAPEILSGAEGVNALASQVKKGEILRVIGLLSRDDAGKAVIRVRNCDEVVVVPPVPKPVPDPTNPRTGDASLLRLLLNLVRGEILPAFRGKSG